MELQVDESLAFVTAAFMKEEEHAPKRLKSNQRQTIDDVPIIFTGLTINKKGNTLQMTQADKISRLRHPIDQEGFKIIRALAQYVVVCTRPDVCSEVHIIAPGAGPTTSAEIKLLCK